MSLKQKPRLKFQACNVLLVFQQSSKGAACGDQTLIEVKHGFERYNCTGIFVDDLHFTEHAFMLNIYL